MTPITEKILPPPLKNKWANRWILIIFLVLPLLTATRITPALSSSNEPILGNLLGTPSLTPTATATATTTITKPTSTQTTTPSSTPQTTVRVSGDSVNLRTGPGTNFAVVRQLTLGEPLILLGRVRDNTWLYVKTSNGQEGWTKATTVNLAGVNLDYHPIKTPSPSSEPTVKVSGDYVNLRTGPGSTFAVVRQLNPGEPLMLLGRVSDNTWLYVKTSDGLEGWLNAVTVNLAGINLDAHPIETLSPSTQITVKVSSDNVNLRTGPRTNFPKVRQLTLSEPLILLGRLTDNTWLYVKTSDGKEGWVTTTSVYLGGVNLEIDYLPVATSPPTPTATFVVLAGIKDRWIDINLSTQTLHAYDGPDLVGSFLVSTGIAAYPTEYGQYHVYFKRLSGLMHGLDYYLPNVPYTMYYSGDFSIHGTYWHHNFGTPMSHGCVNMDTAEAEWLYNWASVGTLVNIHY